MNEATFKQIKQGSCLVNTAHAHLIDEHALASALKDGRLRGAAIDVFEMDAFNPLNGPLRDAPNLLVTPRTAFYSEQSSKEMREMAAQEVRRCLLNTKLRNCVNKEMIGVSAGASSVSAGATASAPLSNSLSGMASLMNGLNGASAATNKLAKVLATQQQQSRSSSSPSGVSSTSSGLNPLTAASFLSSLSAPGVLSSASSSGFNPASLTPQQQQQLLAQLSCKLLGY
jgi:hypothetical protein